MARDIEAIARRLGAKVVCQVPDVGGGAFGMARLGEADLSKQLMKRAHEVLADKDEAHTFLLHSFEHRITEALEGKPHTGPLPVKQLERLAAMPPLLRYVVDRLRKHSRILEPEQDIDPYSPWAARISDLDKALVELANLSDRQEIPARVQKLLKEAGRGAVGHVADIHADDGEVDGQRFLHYCGRAFGIACAAQ